MDARNEAGVAPAGGTNVTRTSGRELVVTRTFNAVPRIVYEAWSKAELFSRWWVPKSMPVPLRACEIDMRTGGKYRLEFGHNDAETFSFYGKYLDVVPGSRIVWTNDEEEEGAVTTVTFEESGGTTLLTFRELYPTKAALDDAFIGMEGGMPEQLDQLDDLLAGLDVR